MSSSPLTASPLAVPGERRDSNRPTSSALRWVCRPFPGLGVDALYALMRLRQQVFVIEQNCAYLDADGLDPQSWHLLAWTSGPAPQLVACLRIVPPGQRHAEPSIGRVATATEVRRTGLGLELVAKGVARCLHLYPRQPIRISAQAHLQDFYGRLGFMSEGDGYEEDGIPHVAMLRPADRPVRRDDALDLGAPTRS